MPSETGVTAAIFSLPMVFAVVVLPELSLTAPAFIATVYSPASAASQVPPGAAIE